MFDVIKIFVLLTYIIIKLFNDVEILSIIYDLWHYFV